MYLFLTSFHKGYDVVKNYSVQNEFYGRAQNLRYLSNRPEMGCDM